MTFIPNRDARDLSKDPNKAQFSKYGTLVDVDDNETPIDIYSGADVSPPSLRTYNFSSAAGPWSISSTNAADTQPVRILRLINDYEIDVIEITLTGQTPVPLPDSTIRILKLKNISNPGASFAGDIYLYETGTATGGIPDVITDTRAYVSAASNENSWSAAIVTVPKDFTYDVYNLTRDINKDSGGGADREANFRLRFSVGPSVSFESVPFAVTNKSGAPLVFDPFIEVQQRTDLVVEAVFVLNDGTEITIGIQGAMKSDDAAKIAILRSY